MSFCVIIPARLKSTRLPHKMLLDIAGKPMIQHVYDIAVQSGANRVIIATDSTEIEQIAHKFNADVCMTSVDHPSGTSRIAEVISLVAEEGGLDYARSVAARYAGEAERTLESLPDTVARTALFESISYVMERHA